MGSSRFVTKDKSKVESTSLTKTFEEACPIYMSYGMSYKDFWYGPVYMTRFYRDANKLRIRQQDENNWMIGMYVYEAIIDCSQILHAFSQKGTKPLPYAEKQFLLKVVMMFAVINAVVKFYIKRGLKVVFITRLDKLFLNKNYHNINFDNIEERDPI